MSRVAQPSMRIRKNRHPRVTCSWVVFVRTSDIGWQPLAACWTWESALQHALRAANMRRRHQPPEQPC